MSDSMDHMPTVHEQLAEARREIDRLTNTIEVAEAIARTAQEQLRDLRAMHPRDSGGDIGAKSRAWEAVWLELERQGMLNVLPIDDAAVIIWSGTERAVHYIRLLGTSLVAARQRADALEVIARTRDGIAEEKQRLIAEVRRLSQPLGFATEHHRGLLTCVSCRQVYSSSLSPVLCQTCLLPRIKDEQPTAAG